MNSGIYEIKCSVNDRVYIGSSVELEQRLHRHKLDLIRGAHPNQHLQRAWDKYGEAAFVFTVTKTCEPEQTLIEEQRALDEAYATVGQDGLFNIAKDALAPTKGLKWTDGQRENQPLAMSKWWSNPENKEKMRAKLKGKKRSQETKKKYSEVAKNRRHSEETKQKLSIAQQKKVQDPEYRKKLSQWSSHGHRIYVGFIRPDGTEEPPITNLAQFCREKGLHHQGMLNIYNGWRNNYKGWTVRKLETFTNS